MKCYICGTELIGAEASIPINANRNSIVIIKHLPVLECPKCKEILIEDPVMERIEPVIKNLGDDTVLEIVNYLQIKQKSTKK